MANDPIPFPKTLIKHIDVCAVGDCLFADCPAQTFRYIES
jgi:hypothetical protein